LKTYKGYGQVRSWAKH